MSLQDLLAAVSAGSPEESLARQVDFDRLPQHIAVIMDGNGRWAAQRHLPRVEGHRAGIDSVREIVETSARIGIPVLTLYAFSVENWKRPATEVSTLMSLLKRYLRLELKTLLRNNIRFRVIGRFSELAPDVQSELQAAEVEAELRWQLHPRFSLVGFGGAGIARSESERRDPEKTVTTGGVGFRYLLARKHGLHMGLDVAQGPDEPIFYVVFGNAWLRP